MLPPLEKLYAVLPAGVDTIIPSQKTFLDGCHL